MALNLTPALAEHFDAGDQRPKLPVIGSSGTTPVSGNYTMQAGVDWPNIPGRELFISNDSMGDITMTVNCVEGTLAWVLHQGETFDERMPPFSSVVVTASGGWRFYIRGNMS